VCGHGKVDGGAIQHLVSTRPALTIERMLLKTTENSSR